MDRKSVRIAHCIKRIAHLLGLLKEEFDDFCDAAGYNRNEEVVKGVDENDRLDKEKSGGDSKPN